MPRRPRRANHDYAGVAAKIRVNGPEITCYADANKFIGTEREKKLASNMRILRPGVFSIYVVLYNTAILVYYPDETFEADNGGWNTPTTVNRLDQFGPKAWYFFHNKKLLWGWARGSRQEEQVCTGRRLPVYPGHSIPVYDGPAQTRRIKTLKSHDDSPTLHRRTQVRRLLPRLLDTAGHRLPNRKDVS